MNRVNCLALVNGECADGRFRRPSRLTCARSCRHRRPIDPAAGAFVPLLVGGEAAPVPRPSSKRSAFDGSRLWAAIHTHRLSDATPAFVDSIAGRVPCGSCRAGWRAMLARTPPDLSSDEAWFQWGVSRHSEVSASIGKPAMTVDEARARWR